MACIRAALALSLWVLVALGCAAPASSGRVASLRPLDLALLPSTRHHLVVDEVAGADASSGRVAGPSPGVPRVGPAYDVPACVHVLASCNASVPAGSGLALEVRVARSAESEWSPWLHLFEWGDVPAGHERRLASDGARVDVDYLVLDAPVRRVQYRLHAFGAGVAVERVALCTSAPGGATPATPRPAPRVAAAPLDVPQRSQRSAPAELAPRICSPTSLAMVLEHHGSAHATVDVARLAFDPRHDLYGNWPRAVQTAHVLGRDALLVRFDDWDAVATVVGSGLPVIASIGVRAGQLDGAPYDSTSGHLVVLCGFDGAGDVVVNDPAAAPPEPVRRVYRREQFERVWMDRGGTAYVLFPPRRDD
jgi:hypothetical protein